MTSCSFSETSSSSSSQCSTLKSVRGQMKMTAVIRSSCSVWRTTPPHYDERREVGSCRCHGCSGLAASDVARRSTLTHIDGSSDGTDAHQNCWEARMAGEPGCLEVCAQKRRGRSMKIFYGAVLFCGLACMSEANAADGC